MSRTGRDGTMLLTGVIQDSGKLPRHSRRHRDCSKQHTSRDSIIHRNEFIVTSPKLLQRSHSRWFWTFATVPIAEVASERRSARSYTSVLPALPPSWAGGCFCICGIKPRDHGIKPRIEPRDRLAIATVVTSLRDCRWRSIGRRFDRGGDRGCTFSSSAPRFRSCARLARAPPYSKTDRADRQSCTCVHM